MKKTKKSVKRASPAKTRKSPAKKVLSPAEIRANTNYQAKYYADKNAAFYNSASYSPAETYGVFKASKKEWNSVVTAAAAVRHNRAYVAPAIPKYVMIAGVPHKKVNGKLVPLASAVEFLTKKSK
jgi:hypothetical protein